VDEDEVGGADAGPVAFNSLSNIGMATGDTRFHQRQAPQARAATPGTALGRHTTNRAAAPAHTQGWARSHCQPWSARSSVRQAGCKPWFNC